MIKEIKGFQNSLKEFVRYLNLLNLLGLEVRVGFVPYDDDAPSIHSGWKDLGGYMEILEFIDRFVKLGGGNEILYSAIDYAVRYADWARDVEGHIILVTD